MSARLTKLEKALIEPFANELARFYEQIEALDQDELYRLVAASVKHSESNCWWASYRAARIVADIANSELQRRKYLASLSPQAPQPEAKEAPHD